MSEPWALVTGASRGIGRAIAQLLLARGRRVVVCGRDSEQLSALEQMYPGRVLALTVDLSVVGAGVAAIDEAESRIGPLAELVLAAGMIHYAPIGQVDEQTLRAQLELNFITPFTMLQHAGTLLAARGAGSMVVVASTLAYRQAPLTSAYAASKAALISAAKSCALELAPKVRVNVVAPGVVDTDMVRVARRSLADGETEAEVIEAQLEQLRALHPLARLGTTADVAEAVLYLLEAQWMTGEVLTLDGGLTLR